MLQMLLPTRSLLVIQDLDCDPRRHARCGGDGLVIRIAGATLAIWEFACWAIVLST